MNADSTAKLPECAPDVYRDGALVLVTHTISARAMEGWVRGVASLSGQRVDWHYAGGRICVLALGDLARVRNTMHAMKPEHDALQAAAAAGRGGTSVRFTPSWTLYEGGECNPAFESIRSIRKAATE